MNVIYQQLIRCITLLMLTAGLLVGCSDNEEKLDVARRAMAIESGEECHLCGMVIDTFAGPKGQLYQRGKQSSRKFCSTRDMFAYLLDPENRHQVQQAYVHNMAVTPWDHPEEDTYIDAKTAWYVIGHRRKGAMGPTLATFKDKVDAVTFTTEFGGALYRFDELTIELIATISQGSNA